MFKQSAQFKKFALISGLIAASVLASAEDMQYGIAPPEVNAQSYILMDYHSGAVLTAVNADQRQYPASLTKMMTSYVVGQAIKQGKIHNSDMVTIGESAWGRNFPDSSKMFLNLNQQVSVEDLNKGVIIVSGNDASVALAEHVSGTALNFVDTMNRYVQQFGLQNTHFTTPHGLDDPNQYSSARDMAIIGAHIIRDLPEEYKIYAEKDFTFNKIKQPNRNGLLWDKTMNVDGMKTGHTSQAGYNLVASATNPGNMRLISVVMGVPTYKGREVESKKLLQWGFSNFETLKALEANKAVSEQTVYYGDEGRVKLGVLQDSFITVPKGKQTQLKARYELNEKYLVQAKQRLIEALDGKRKANSLNQANEIFVNFSSYPYFEEDKQREIIDKITLKDIQSIREKLLSKATSVRALSVGNFTDNQVKNIISKLEKIAKNNNSELAKYRYLDINKSTKKLNAIKFVPNEDNALSIAYMAKGYDELAGEVRAMLLKDIISRWYFDDLRTNKQLGYVVYATQAKIGKTSGIRFMVQSPNTSPKGIMQHNERFFAESLQKLSALSETEFNQFKESLLNKLERKPESLSQEFENFSFDYARGNQQFDRKEKLIQAVKNLMKNDILAFYQNAVIEQQGLVFISQALGTKVKAADAISPQGFEKVENVEELQKAFEVKFY